MVKRLDILVLVLGYGRDMYNKRIAFVISTQGLKPHGGIGQFALGFVREMTKANVKVDIIIDLYNPKKNGEFMQTLKNCGASFIYTDSLSYSKHNATYMFGGDSYNLERQINFRNAILKAFETNLYDSIVCNSHESYRVISEMGLDKCIQIINYTHYETQVFSGVTTDPFLESVRESMLWANQTTNVVATQSIFNAKSLINGVELPIFVSEPALLQKYDYDRKGVLFIGTNEDRKGAKTFLEVIKATGLPAKILTNEPGAKKFEASLKEIGAEYEIKTSIIGQEKVDFIASARVALNVAIGESFGMAFQEQIIQLPSVGLSGMRWLNNHPSNYYFHSSKSDLAVLVQQLYDVFPTAESYYATGALEYYQQRETQIAQMWIDTFDSFNPIQSTSTKAGILQHSTVKYSDYITSLNRDDCCIDDFRSVYTNKHKYRVIHTDSDTWLTTDADFVAPEAVSTAQSANLFEGL